MTIKEFVANWTYKGVHVMVDEVTLKFAADWAGYVVQEIKKKEAAAQSAKKVILNG